MEDQGSRKIVKTQGQEYRNEEVEHNDISKIRMT